MLSALINLFLSIAWAKKPTPAPDPEIMTNFLTENDLNRAFVKLIGIVAIPVGLQIFIMIKESRSGLVKEVRDMNNVLRELVPMVKSIKEDYVTNDKARYIARMEAHDVLDRAKKWNSLARLF